ncbi:MAG: hypothetical protein NDF56_06575 [archaeon GB-1845-036]|nr:hypothetical protein [Candidatus Culexmicrobium thermophilum]HDO19914.1 hypothetical protein [Candidatus Bathyarchaeota archaeon]
MFSKHLNYGVWYRRVFIILAFIFGVFGVYLIYLSNFEKTIQLFNGNFSFDIYYSGLAFLILSLLSFLVPVMFPPKRFVASYSFNIVCPFCGVKMLFVDGVFKCPVCKYVVEDTPVLISLKDLTSIVDLAIVSCKNVCNLVSRNGECEALRRYSALVNASLPLNCPFIEKVDEKKKVKVKV